MSAADGAGAAEPSSSSSPADDAAAGGDLPDLKGLLASLASFAKAAQSLPTGDALEFESSFPEFQFSLNQAQESLLQILQSAISSQQQQDDNNAASAESLEEALADLDASSLDDPWLWERAADACDALVEQVEAYLLLNSSSNAADDSDDDVVAPLQQFANRAHAAGSSQFHRMVQNTAHTLPKPQEVYGFSTSTTQDPSSSRTAPFVPAVHPDKPHAVTPLDLTLQPGHGYDTRYGALRSSNKSSRAAVRNCGTLPALSARLPSGNSGLYVHSRAARGPPSRHGSNSHGRHFDGRMDRYGTRPAGPGGAIVPRDRGRPGPGSALVPQLCGNGLPAANQFPIRRGGC